jgi:hypothetical protein
LFDWPFDNCLSISLVLGAAGLGLAFAWYRTNQYAFGLGSVIVVALLVIFFVLFFIYGETARDQVERKVRELVAGVDNKDVDKIFQNISDRFEYTQDSTKLNKQQLRSYAVEALRRPELKGMIADDIRVDPIDRDAGKASVLFRVIIKGDNDRIPPFQVKAEFILDPDKQWRMKSFTLHNMMGDQSQISLPLP